VDWLRAVAAAPAFEAAACVDVDAGALARAATIAGVPASCCVRTVQEALVHGPFDAAIISTPADDHVDTCGVLLDRGLGVMVEKPFTLALADAVDIVQSADARQRPQLVAQNYRYQRSFRAAREVVRAGRLGRVLSAHWHYYRVPHVMSSSLARLPHSVLWGMGIHHLDALRFVLGEDAAAVSADLFTARDRTGLDGASINVQLRFPSGARATYSATYESSGHEYFERGQEFYARIAGERATLHVVHRWLVLCEQGRLPRLVPRGGRTISEERALLDQFETALRTGDAGPASARDNLATMAIAEACVRSAAERRWIEIGDLLHD
jgi:predicted dehydrogenase